MDKNKPNIAIVAVHPDDVAFSMGGTTLLLKEKYNLHVFCATSGQRGYTDPQGRTRLAKPPDEEFGKIRMGEEAAACKMMNAQLQFLGQVDGEVFAERQVIEKLAEAFAALKPVAMFTLWSVDVPDHAAGSLMATKAMHLAGLFHTSEIYFYETNLGGQTNQFIPDLYVNITDVIEQKREMLRCHKTQFTEESVEKTMRQNAMRGRLARCDYAEPFKTPDPLVNARWGRKAHYLLLDL